MLKIKYMLYLILLCTAVSGACLWPTPSRLFSPSLLRLQYQGLDEMGSSRYTISVNESEAISDINYGIVSVTPEDIYYDKDAVEFEIFHTGSLDWNDFITVTIGAESPCWPGHTIGTSPYVFNVTSSVMLYHSYNDTLAPMSEYVWTSDGWRSQSHLVLYNNFMSEPVAVAHPITDGPCPGSWITSNLEVLNTSKVTHWDISTRKPDGVTEFIKGTLPRCHRAELGNVCIVRAHTRLGWPADCAHNVSIWQSVSQVARLTRRSYNTEYPSNFNAARRFAVPDGNDLRYDMCTSTVCSGNCTSSRVENDALATDGDIFIRQEQTVTDRWIETVCTFEVVGFLDNIWSPNIYMRKWYGYEWF